MVQRNRPHRLELEMASAQGISKGSQNAPNASAHATRPFRQFSTRSRAKSTASFKGLHRILPIDGTSDMDNSYNFGEHSFRKSRSSDSLYRKKAMSGLNMTALARVKSHPSHINHASHSRSGSMNSSACSPGAGSMGLKPSTSKATHSVVDLHDGDAVCDDGTTTDEEVEYFSDEEEDDDGETKSPKSSPIPEDLPKEKPVRVQMTPEESKMLSKSFTELTLPYQNSEGDVPLVNQPSYKAPSSWIRPRQDDKLLESGYNGVTGAQPPEYANLPGDAAMVDNDKIDSNMESDDYRDDHIDNPTLNSIHPGTIMESDTHSLKRQVKNFPDTTQKSGLPVMRAAAAGTPETPEGGDNNYLSQRRNSDNQQYVPSMILSQSTGMERRFDQPASVQNSFANNYHHATADAHQSGDNYKENRLTHPSNLPTSALDLTRQPQQQQLPQQLPQQVLQHPPQQQASASKNITSHNFSTSISSLTSTLQNMAPENAYSTSRKGNLMRRKPSQLSFPASNVRASHGDLPTQFLHRESPAPSSDINNFAQFLKSGSMDGESRTQRKLWLQRENSIMDLSSQHDSSDSIFMASNIEVKRECERISHEYTNVRRFSNPIEEALSRVESEQKLMGMETLSGASQTSSDVLDAIFSNPVNGSREMDEILSQSHNTKLHNVLQCIWREESALFNKDISHMIRNNSSNNKSPISAHSSRTSLKNLMGSGAALQHQRMINSLQPTTRAVNRRMEHALHHQQRL